MMNNKNFKNTFNLFNPRRSNFDIKNSDHLEEQINWEHIHLKNSDIIIRELIIMGYIDKKLFLTKSFNID